jgi:hypothetical protein
MAGIVSNIVKRTLVTKCFGGNRCSMDSDSQPSRQAVIQGYIVS